MTFKRAGVPLYERTAAEFCIKFDTSFRRRWVLKRSYGYVFHVDVLNLH